MFTEPSCQSAQRIAAFTQRVHKSHPVVSAAVMFHDLLKTALAFRKALNHVKNLWRCGGLDFMELEFARYFFFFAVATEIQGSHLLKGI